MTERRVFYIKYSMCRHKCIKRFLEIKNNDKYFKRKKLQYDVDNVNNNL